MPKKSHQSQQAKAQRASKKRGFESAFMDNDPVERLVDPDFEPENGGDTSDSDKEILPAAGFTFSIVEGAMDISDSLERK
ncbi:hypothetical protein BDQ12DRAFT_722438 [Crucibulum laeve]|uniref:Uncharacterized protein n=1 Tax=Crucibulum laeve TaxID=68775 RepID=A0A5C3M2W0_9AGAR|nr:hypothetical protein BDQ12DRAFT_722438 [Crucibulum laeve]